MQYDKVSKAILRKMLFDTRIGGRHLGLDDLKKGFPSHEKGDVENRLKKLVRENLVLKHPTRHGMQYALNTNALEVVHKIIQ